MIRYTIKLTIAKVDELKSIINKGSHTSQTFRAAYILLNCDEGEYSEKVTNEQISKVLKIGMRTIDRVKKEVNAWQSRRNNKHSKINWQFKCKDARI